MLNKIIRSCLFYSGTRWCPRCIAFDSRIYCEKEQLGGFLWRTFYYAVKKDPYLSKDPVICLMEKRNSVCMSTSFIRYILPTLALSKSGFRVETESRLLSAGFRQLPSFHEIVRKHYNADRKSLQAVFLTEKTG